MATYLELAQRTALMSGVVGGTGLPVSVLNQTSADLQRIILWVRDAWVEIQTAEHGWLFLRRRFSASTTGGTAEYTPTALGIADFGRWLMSDDRRAGGYGDCLTLYRTATGVSDEAPLTIVDWEAFERRWRRGSQVQGRPLEAAIAPDNALWLGPVPDAVYTLQGPYERTAQVLAANADTPLCPARFHDVISYLACMKLAAFDEAGMAFAGAQAQYRPLLAALKRDQLPPPRWLPAALA